jgi:hypothetical protein
VIISWRLDNLRRRWERQRSCLRSSSNINAAKSQRVLYTNWDDTQDFGSPNSMGKPRWAICWPD